MYGNRDRCRHRAYGSTGHLIPNRILIQNRKSNPPNPENSKDFTTVGEVGFLISETYFVISCRAKLMNTLHLLYLTSVKIFTDI